MASRSVRPHAQETDGRGPVVGSRRESCVTAMSPAMSRKVRLMAAAQPSAVEEEEEAAVMTEVTPCDGAVMTL